MSLHQCKYCGAFISEKAQECPNCGSPVQLELSDKETPAYQQVNYQYQQNERKTPKGLGFRIVGWILLIFGILDLLCYYVLEIDITGVFWSSYVSTFLGGLLLSIGKKE